LPGGEAKLGDDPLSDNFAPLAPVNTMQGVGYKTIINMFGKMSRKILTRFYFSAKMLSCSPKNNELQFVKHGKRSTGI
jgi:hypothetical protein